MSDVDIGQDIFELREMAAAANGQELAKAGAGNSGEFTALLKSVIENINDIQQQAGKLSDSLEKGDPLANLTEVMATLQKAKISYQAMVEFRNRVVVPYQDIIDMQI
jgi:flagellar hook-basal body complex protein FliE